MSFNLSHLYLFYIALHILIIYIGLRVCLLQFKPQKDLTKSLIHLKELVETAANQHHPHIIALPGCFSFSYCTESSIINEMAETIETGKTCHTLSKLAKKFSVYIVGGTIVERDGFNLYNTSTVWNPNGELIARYRKVSEKLWKHSIKSNDDTI